MEKIDSDVRELCTERNSDMINLTYVFLHTITKQIKMQKLILNIVCIVQDNVVIFSDFSIIFLLQLQQ